MADNLLCPNCGMEIEISSAFSAQLREHLCKELEIPLDAITDVPVGVHGGDLLHLVGDPAGQECGLIPTEFHAEEIAKAPWE